SSCTTNPGRAALPIADASAVRLTAAIRPIVGVPFCKCAVEVRKPAAATTVEHWFVCRQRLVGRPREHAAAVGAPDASPGNECRLVHVEAFRSLNDTQAAPARLSRIAHPADLM